MNKTIGKQKRVQYLIPIIIFIFFWLISGLSIQLKIPGRIHAATSADLEGLDYSNLQTAVDKAGIYLANEEFMDQYTEKSIQVYQWTYEKAKEILVKRSATSQEEIEESAQVLGSMPDFLIIKVLSVTFENCEGTGFEEQKITYGYQVKQPQDPVKEGYVFGGWYNDEDFTNKYDFQEPVKKDFVLYAKWTVDAKRLEDAIQYAKGILADEDYLVRFLEDSINTYQEIVDFAAELIVGDYLESVEEMDEYIDILMNPEEVLELKEFTVTFVSNGGSVVEEQTVKYGFQSIEPEGPVRTGYLFAGWFIDESCTQPFDFETVIEQDYILYAKWNVDYQELENAVKETTDQINDPSFTIPYTKESVKNYQDKLDAANKMLDERNAESAEEITALIEALHQGKADLQRKQFTVSFLDDDGTELDKQFILYGDTAILPACPVKEDYLFIAWYTDKLYKTVFDFNMPIMMDTVIYSKWDVDYTNLEQAVTYVKAKVTDEVEMAPFTEESVKYFCTVIEKAEKMLTEKTALNAQDTKDMIAELQEAQKALEVSVFQFVFDSNGGTSSKEQNIHYGDTATEPENPTREGYIFKGWFMDDELTELYDFTTKVTRDRTVYAKWVVDYTNLGQELDNAEETLSDSVLLESFTQKTVLRLQNAYNKAKDVYDNQSAHTALEVKNLISDIHNATKALTKKVFTVAFESDAGSEIPSQYVEYANKVTRPENPEREGYWFDGWYLDDEYTQSFDFTTEIKDNYVLLAKWNLDYEPLEIAIEQAREVINDTVLMEQYADATVFAYMSVINGAADILQEQSAESPDEINEIVQSLIDARDALTVKTLSVVFNTSGGSAVATKYVTYGNTVKQPSSPSKTGYLFESWYSDKECTQPFDFTAKVKKNISVYAKWKIDYTNLENAIETAEKTAGDEEKLVPYTEQSIEIYKKLIADAKHMVANDTAVSAEDVNEQVILLQNPGKTLVKKELSITFETSGGTFIPGQYVTYGESARKPENPTKTDFIFAGWFADKDLTKNYVFSADVKQDTVIYAKWTLDYKELKEAVEAAGKKLQNTEFIAPFTSESIENFQAVYNMASNMLDKSSADSVNSIKEMIESLQAAEKALTKQTLTVTFETNGGSEVASQHIIYGEYVVKVEAPTRENYIFAGWYADVSLTKTYNFTNPVKQNLTIYAKWDVDYARLEVAITEAESRLSNETFIEPYTETSVEHYRKVLENAKAVLKSKSACTAEDIKDVVDALDMALTALEIQQFQISYNVNGGNSVDAQMVSYGAAVAEPVAPKKEGYLFAGWYKEEELKELYDFTVPVKADIILYAKWNIDYSELSKAVQAAQAKLGDTDFVAPYTAGTLKHYQDTLARAKQVLAEESALSADEVSLLIQELTNAEGGLDTKVLTVTFDSKDGSFVQPKRISYGETVTSLQTPVRDGYGFTGWYTDEELSKIFDQSIKVTADMTLYAGWTLNYDELRVAVKKAEVKMAEEEFSAKYKTSALFVFNAAYNKAKAMVEEENASSPEEIQTALLALEDAQNKLEIKKLTVSFVVNGGTAVEKQTIVYGETAVKPATPEKTGFTFDNWYTSKAFETVYDFAEPVKKNVTLYAKWDVFYGDLEEAIQFAQGVLENADIVSYTDTSIEDYRAILQEAVEMLENDTAKSAEQVTILIGKLKTPENTLIKKVLEVTFDCNGGTTIAAQDITYGEKVSKPTNPQKAGYIFVGWYADSTLTDDYSFGNPVTESMVIYAKWELNYSALQEALDAAKAKLADPDFIPSKTDSTMANYKEVYDRANAMCTNKNAASVDDIARMITELEKAEGQLQTRELIVTFDSNEGTQVASSTLLYGDKVKQPANPEKAEYEFAGWYVDESFTIAYDFGKAVKAEITLYAKWKVDYTELEKVIKEAETDLSNPAFTEQYDEASIQQYSDCVKQAMLMAENDTCKVAAEAEVMVHTLRSIKANLKKAEFLVTFVSNGGTEVAVQSVTYDSIVTEPDNPTKAGYVFAGWFTSEDLNHAYNFETPVRGTVILYAKWDVEYRVLDDAKKAADEKVTPAKKACYTEESWNKYVEAYQNAVAMLAYQNAVSAEEVTALADALTAAVTGLDKAEFKVTFDSQGGSEVTDQTVIYGEKATEPAVPVKAGYVFTGWITEDGIQYDFHCAVETNITLTAEWVLDYTGLETAIAVAEGELEDASFTRMFITESIENYKALLIEAKEMAEAKSAESAEQISQMVERLSNVVLEKKKFTVTFVTGEGSSVPDQTVEYGNSITELGNPVRTDYVFAGWFVDEDTTAAYDLEMPVTGNITVYAKWDLDYSPLQNLVDEIQAQMDRGEFYEIYADADATMMRRFHTTFKYANEFLTEKAEYNVPDDVYYWLDVLQEKLEALTSSVVAAK